MRSTPGTPAGRLAGTLLTTTLATATAAMTMFTATPAQAGGGVQEAWVARYNGPTNDDDATVVVVASDGSVYVTGFTFVQASGNLFVPRMLLIKYDADGNELWTRMFGAGSVGYSSWHVALDPDENIIITGGQSTSVWQTVKYAPDGNELWSRAHNTGSSYVTHPCDLAVDSAGNVYLTGDAGLGETVAITLKINAAGTIVWTKTETGPDNTSASARALLVDDAGNVYVGGSALVDGAAGEYALWKYDTNGNRQWIMTDGSFGSVVYDYVSDLAFAPNGDVITAGIFGSNSFQGFDGVIKRFTTDGSEVWSRTFGQPDVDEVFSHVAVDDAGTIYVGGSIEVQSNADDALIASYESDGTFRWSREYGGFAGDDDFARDLVVDAQGFPYLVGSVQPFNGINFYFTTAYSPAGDLRWEQQYGGPTEGGSSPVAAAIAPDRSVIVTGNSQGFGTENDIATIKYVQESSATSAVLEDFSITIGSLLSGGLSELGESDDARLVARSAFGVSVLEPNVVELRTGYTTDVTNPAALNVTVESRINHPTGTTKLRLMNRSTGQWAPVAEFPVTNSESSTTTSGIAASDYVEVDGRIDVSTKHIVAAVFSALGFESGFDFVGVSVE